MRQVLFTPWRYAYITSNETAADACFLCAAGGASDDREWLVVHRTEHHLVVLNRHPYNNGHLMIAPLAHVASPTDAAVGVRAEFWPLVLAAQRVLEAAYSPHGFNLGMNLGTAAGAGVPDHYHFHLVPRWEGDTNYMAVVGDVRLVPEDLDATWAKLRRLFADESAAEGAQ